MLVIQLCRMTDERAMWFSYLLAWGRQPVLNIANTGCIIMDNQKLFLNTPLNKAHH